MLISSKSIRKKMQFEIVCLIILGVYFVNYQIVLVLIGKIMSKVFYPKDNTHHPNEAKMLAIILQSHLSNQRVQQQLVVEIIGVYTIMFVVILLQQYDLD
jgi:hypothetical protein